MVVRFLRLALMAALIVSFSSGFLSGCLPAVPAYPYQKSSQVLAEARRMSDKLEAYIKDWLDGKVSAKIPDELLPKGMTKKVKNLYLQRPEDIIPEKQWMIRPAQKINFNALHGYFPDPNCTYIKLGVFYAPFGSKLVIQGEFPHSRFFDIQASPSFDPAFYYYDKSFGVGEVPIVDADIEPLPGNVNPFRVGANRKAKNRSYKVTFDLAVGNAAKLNPAFKPPYYRAPGNKRIAGGIQYQGPWGQDSQRGHGRGLWDTGDLWIRYYGIDKGKGSLGGVSLPKAYYVLPDGRKYFINADYSEFLAQANLTIPARSTPPVYPAKIWDSSAGWDKQFGIFLSIASGLASVLGVNDKEYVRNLDRGVTSRGENQPPPGSYEPSNSSCTYINYLTRGLSLEKDKIGVLTGKLPTFPDTRNGASQLSPAQMRYWSMTGYDANIDINQKLPGAAVTSVMDDEVVLDSQRRYIIVYSREKERPANANSKSGVTWVNWGPTAGHTWTLRWLSVAPEWNMGIAPNERNLTWSKSTWSGKNYDKKLIGENDHDGFLGEYLPEVHYMSRKEFEALGSSVNYFRIPKWK
jgi:hypothetical protein